MSMPPTVWKSFFRANEPNVGQDQGFAQVAGSPAGHFFSIWSDTHAGAIVGRRFDALGAAQTAEVSISAGAGTWTMGDAAATSGGGVAAAFLNKNGGTSTLSVSLRGPSLEAGRTDTIAVTGADLGAPAITMLGGNSYAVAYRSDTQLRASIVNAAGTAGTSFGIGDGFDGTTAQARMATLTNGSFVAVTSSQIANASAHQVAFQIINASGTTTVGRTNMSSPNAASEVSVSALLDGGFVATWTDQAGDGAGSGIRAAVYNASGQAVRSNFLVNVANQGGTQDESSVIGLADGGFMVAWEDDAAGLVRAQRYDVGGNAIGGPATIRSEVASDSPDLTLLSDGRVGVSAGAGTTGQIDTYVGILDLRVTLPDNATGANIVGDATSDLLLLRDANGTRSLLAFEVNNHAVVGTSSLGSVGADWKVAGAGDFDGDSDGDILIHRDIDAASRTFLIERMGPSGVETAVTVGTIGSEWAVAGTGDFNADRDADVLLYKDVGVTRSFLILDMQNNAARAGLDAGAVGNDWVVDGTGDVDRDGDSDLLMHRDAAGVRDLTVFRMQASGVVEAKSLGAIGPDWQVEAAADFDRDGDADLLMRQDTLGNRGLSIFEIENAAVVKAHTVATVGNNLWVVGTGDFDRDGDADIALRYDQGAVRNYLTLEIQQNAMVSPHAMGAIGGDWVIA
jgi:hypothetical protein